MNVHSDNYKMENTSHQTESNANDEIRLKSIIIEVFRFVKFLKTRWVFLLIAMLLGGAIGALYAYFKKPIYKAELSFALDDDKSSNLSVASGLASQFGFGALSGGGSAFSGDNLLSFMKSRSMVQKALLTSVDMNGRNQTLAELYIEFNDLRRKWANDPKLANIKFSTETDSLKFSRIQDSILGTFYKSILSKNLIVEKLNKNLSIIVLKVNSENEFFSKYFAENLAKEVSDFYVETKIKKSVQNLAILQYQTDSVRRALNKAITGVASNIDLNPNLNPARQVLKVPSQRKQIDAQANQAILNELVKNLEFSKISLRKETPLIQIIDRPILPLDKEKLGLLKGFIFGSITLGFLAIMFLFIKKIVNRVGV
ncbi:MAG: Wzz/FepE/Etk N-terminal domain-containing protein [Daejeonella sp.]